ncbi:MAG: copper homeostasis protein CutC [Sphingobacteriaceae bacterium]|nr:copper homeostasis protein CutC [Cytophagaceae bacterium]
MNYQKQVEVCAYSLEAALTAQRAGAYRIELCASPPEGGTTPPAGLIRLVKAQTTLPLCVMIRPRGGDFCYSESEFEQMQADLDVALHLGADGVVLGLLLPDGTVDVPRTRQLVEQAQPMPVTFHRAFDMAADLSEALEAVIEAGCRRLLTSSGMPTAYEGREMLSVLARQARARIELLAGSGVNAQNAAELLNTGVNTLHLTGKSTRPSAMTFRNQKLSMGGNAGFDEYEIQVADEAKIRAVVDIVDRFNKPPFA